MNIAAYISGCPCDSESGKPPKDSLWTTPQRDPYIPLHRYGIEFEDVTLGQRVMLHEFRLPPTAARPSAADLMGEYFLL